MFKYILFSLALISFIGCQTEEAATGIDSETSVEAGTTANSGSENDSEENQDLEAEEINQNFAQTYLFNLGTGKCRDGDGVEGLNADYDGACGDFVEVDLGNKELAKRTYWGADFSGAYLDQAKYKLDDLTFIEAKFDIDTKFKFSEDKTKKKLIKSHKKAFKKSKKWIARVKAKTKKRREKYKKLKKKIRTMASSPKKDKKIEKALKLKNKVNSGKQLKKDLSRKKKRHKETIKEIKEW